MISSRILQAAQDLRRIALSLVEEQLRQSPHITFGKHVRKGQEVEVVRYRTSRNGKIVFSEFSLCSKSGKK